MWIDYSSISLPLIAFPILTTTCPWSNTGMLLHPKASTFIPKILPKYSFAMLLRTAAWLLHWFEVLDRALLIKNVGSYLRCHSTASSQIPTAARKGIGRQGLQKPNNELQDPEASPRLQCTRPRTVASSKGVTGYNRSAFWPFFASKFWTATLNLRFLHSKQTDSTCQHLRHVLIKSLHKDSTTTGTPKPRMWKATTSFKSGNFPKTPFLWKPFTFCSKKQENRERMSTNVAVTVIPMSPNNMKNLIYHPQNYLSPSLSPINSPISSPMLSPISSPINAAKGGNGTFVHKLYNMVSDKNYQHLISWNNSGTVFTVCNMLEFSRDVLPQRKLLNIN